MKTLIAIMIVLASAWVADGKVYSCGLAGCLPEGCDISEEGIIRHNVYKNGEEMKFYFETPRFNGGVTIGQAQLAMLEHTGKVTIHMDASRDWGTREITFETDDRAFTFTAEELKNMLNGKTYTAKVKVKK